MGAAIAPGNHTWKGTWADLVAAATRTNTAATVAAVPSMGGISERRVVPVASVTSTKPARSARPPDTVISSARRAARRAVASVFLKPTSRKEVTDVSSQNTNSVQTESDQTKPTMAVLNASRVVAKRPSPAAPAEK